MHIICRTCGELTTESFAKNLYNEPNNVLLHQIEVLTGLWLEEQELLSDHICPACLQDLKSAVAFRERCIFVQVLQQQQLVNCRKLDHDEHSVHFEPLIDEVISEDRNEDCSNEYINNNLATTQMPNCSNKLECEHNKATQYNTNNTTLKCQKSIPTNLLYSLSDEEMNCHYYLNVKSRDIIKIDSQNFKAKIGEHLEQQSPQFQDEDITDNNIIQQNDSAKAKKSETEMCKSTSNGNQKSENMKPKRKYTFVKRKPRTTKHYYKYKREYVCEKCGKHYRSLFTFREHAVHHTGVKNFQCSKCLQTFWTSRNLKQHELKHTDARPFNCRYCERTFRSRSHRNTHERLHTNSEPFPCRMCHKTYTSINTRDVHELDHKGVRKFFCEICDRAFLYRKHLFTHKKSKIHMAKEAEIKAAENTQPKI